MDDYCAQHRLSDDEKRRADKSGGYMGWARRFSASIVLAVVCVCFGCTIHPRDCVMDDYCEQQHLSDRERSRARRVTESKLRETAERELRRIGKDPNRYGVYVLNRPSCWVLDLYSLDELPREEETPGGERVVILRVIDEYWLYLRKPDGKPVCMTLTH